MQVFDPQELEGFIAEAAVAELLEELNTPDAVERLTRGLCT